LLAEIASLPRSAWQVVELDLPQRKFKTPRVVEKEVSIRGYHGVNELFS
jgi:hypothetical protein